MDRKDLERLVSEFGGYWYVEREVRALKKGPFLKACEFYKKKNKKGQTYYKAYVGMLALFLRKNEDKRDEEDPDLVLYFGPNEVGEE